MCYFVSSRNQIIFLLSSFPSSLSVFYSPSSSRSFFLFSFFSLLLLFFSSLISPPSFFFLLLFYRTHLSLFRPRDTRFTPTTYNALEHPTLRSNLLEWSTRYSRIIITRLYVNKIRVTTSMSSIIIPCSSRFTSNGNASEREIKLRW